MPDLGITNDDPLKHIEDLKRIIVMNVKCDLRTAPSDDEIPSNKMYLTSKNLPDMPMSDFIDILKGIGRAWFLTGFTD